MCRIVPLNYQQLCISNCTLEENYKEEIDDGNNNNRKKMKRTKNPPPLPSNYFMSVYLYLCMYI